jgi:hypothetical protein
MTVFRSAHPRTAGWALAAVGALLLFAPPGRAGLVPVTLDPNGPVVTSFDGSLSYTFNGSTGGHFHSDTTPLILTGDFLGNNSAFFDSSSVSIDLNVTKTGSLVGTGTFQLTGAVDLNGDHIDDATGTLLTGTITAFGANQGPPTDPFDGVFQITGGLLTAPVSLSGGGTQAPGFRIGQAGGFFLFAEDVTQGTLGDFSHSFASDSTKSQVGVVIPEPATAVLGLLAGALLGCRSAVRRRAGGRRGG